MITFKVEGADVMARKFARAAVIVPAKAVPSGLQKCGLLVERSAKIKAPVGDTGHLRGNIRVTNLTPVSVDVVSHADYSVYVEVGTDPHDIRPKNGKALFWPGAAHPVAVVHHPGTPAQPFMRPALDENKAQIMVILGREVVTTVQGAIA